MSKENEKCPQCKSVWFWHISGWFSWPMILKCGDCKFEWERSTFLTDGVTMTNEIKEYTAKKDPEAVIDMLLENAKHDTEKINHLIKNAKQDDEIFRKLRKRISATKTLLTPLLVLEHHSVDEELWRIKEVLEILEGDHDMFIKPVSK